MQVTRPAHAWALALVLFLCGQATAIASPGDVDTPYDGHDTVAATAAPYSSIAPFATTLSYNSSTFTTAATERDVNGMSDGVYTNKTGCGATPPYWGGRSGWVRFDSAVSGRLRVDITTGGYDPIVVIWNAPSAPLGTTSFANMANQDCNAVRTDAGESIFNLEVQANRAVHVETLGFCGRASYWTSAPGCTDGAPFDDLDGKSPGGPTSVALSFQCDNVDADAVCDSLDACPSVPGAQSGCPDRDRDGVLDGADRCPDLAGTDSGCPADQDGDGVANAVDQCATQQGYAPSGCPDGDGDGVFHPADKCPTVKGIAPDGCADGDGDGRSDPTDACPMEFGASSTGCVVPLGANIRWDFMRRSYRLKRLQVTTVAGAKIEVRCTARRKAACPFGKRTFTAGAKPKDVKSLFRGRSLRGRALTLSFRVTKRGYLGTYKRYTYDGVTSPRTLDRCISSAGKLQKCPR